MHMKALKSIALALVAVWLVGCQSTLRVVNYQPPKEKLKPSDGILIVVPPDAWDEPGSGEKCAKTMVEAFRQYCQRMKLSDEIADLDIQIKKAADEGFVYVLESQLHKWEEEPTEWTGEPDAMDVELRIYQSRDGGLVTQTRLNGKSKWATFGGDQVEHLLKPLAERWVRSLYEGGEFSSPK
jgi:hypothetical protein